MKEIREDFSSATEIHLILGMNKERGDFTLVIRGINENQQVLTSVFIEGLSKSSLEKLKGDIVWSLEKKLEDRLKEVD